MSTGRRSPIRIGRAFSLVECVLASVIVATMFAAGLAAAGSATRDRRTQNVDDYFDFSETSPRDRSGVAIPGTTGWKWQASVAYQPVISLTGAGSPPSGGGGLIGAVTGVLGGLLGSGAPSATDTGLKRIIVTVTSPGGKLTTLTGMRSSAGPPDRVSTGTGFRTGATYTITVGRQQLPLSTGINLENTPAQ